MKVLHPLLLVLALAGWSGADTASAAPVRNTFYDCGADITCADGVPSVLMQFITSDFMVAPAVPPAGTFTPASWVDVTQQVVGSFDALGISTFNTNNAIGGLFVVNNLIAANGRQFSQVMAIGAATRSALRLDWYEGSYLGLGYVNCFNLSCSQQTTIRGYTKLVVERVLPDDNRLPEPQSLALVLAALAAGVGVRARRGARQADGA